MDGAEKECGDACKSCCCTSVSKDKPGVGAGLGGGEIYQTSQSNKQNPHRQHPTHTDRETYTDTQIPDATHGFEDRSCGRCVYTRTKAHREAPHTQNQSAMRDCQPGSSSTQNPDKHAVCGLGVLLPHVSPHGTLHIQKSSYISRYDRVSVSTPCPRSKRHQRFSTAQDSLLAQKPTKPLKKNHATM